MAPAGDGHFSPIGGYHADKDMVLILDTARFKYPPHWVPLADLYMAMAPADPATGKPRGYIRLTANPSTKSVMFTLDRPSRYIIFLHVGVVFAFGYNQCVCLLVHWSKMNISTIAT